MTVNVDNINLMIEAISKEAEPIRMVDWLTRNEPCGTTACLAGWANILANHAQGKLNKQVGVFKDDDGIEHYADLSDTTAASKWMGLSDEDGEPRTNLFYQGTVDRLSPADRKTATIALLTKLRDTGKGDWVDVVETGYDEHNHYFAKLRA